MSVTDRMLNVLIKFDTFLFLEKVISSTDIHSDEDEGNEIEINYQQE